jgi:hypothetical protein
MSDCIICSAVAADRAGVPMPATGATFIALHTVQRYGLDAVLAELCTSCQEYFAKYKELRKGGDEPKASASP